MRRYWKVFLIVLAAALALSLLESVGLRVRHAGQGRWVPWYDPWWRPLPHWLTMALVAPLAVALSTRFRVGPGRWKWLPIHVAGALAFAVLHTFIGAVVYSRILSDYPPLGGVVRGQLAFDIGLELLSYAVIAIGTHAYLGYDDARRAREAAARAEADLAQARLRILRSQLQPHVLFNTLQAISTLALRHKDDAVVLAIARLSDVLRAGLDEEGSEVIPLSRELATTDSFLEIQHLRMGDRLRVVRDIDPDALDGCVPPLLLQPLVENALEHGFAGDRGGTLTLEAHRRNGRLELNISDDGVGLGGNERVEGTGLRITRERLRQLYQDDQSLELEPRNGGGTTVRLTIPYRPFR